MARRKRKFLRLTVTCTEEYLIDMDCVDGRSEQEVIDEWFKNFPMYNRHAARDAGKVGYTKKLANIESHGIVDANSMINET